MQPTEEARVVSERNEETSGDFAPDADEVCTEPDGILAPDFYDGHPLPSFEIAGEGRRSDDEGGPAEGGDVCKAGGVRVVVAEKDDVEVGGL